MSRVSNPNGTVLNVWSDDADDFDHANLAANWDALDEAQVPLGGIIMWWRKSVGVPAVPWSTGSVWQPCDGRTVLSANHDLTGGDLVLPDLRGFAAMGAQVPDQSSPAYPGDATAGSASDAASGAPAIRGLVGSNTQQTVPAHYHDHDHIHLMGRSGTNNDVGVASQDDAGDPYFFNTDAAGVGINAARVNHSHHLLSQFTSASRKPNDANQRVKDLGGSYPSQDAMTATSKQKKPTGGSDTQPSGGTAADNLQVSPVQQSYGLVFLMKVRVTPRP